MNDIYENQHRSVLKRIAHQVMIDRGLNPDFPEQVITQANEITSHAKVDVNVRDLRSFLWCSIDNDDSLDLDQLTCAEANADGSSKVYVAIADVDSVVKYSSPIDDYAKQNTVSVYTVAEIFPMLPERLSTDITSLKYGEERLSIVVEMLFSDDGSLTGSDVYRAIVFNKAKLAYKSVADWMDGSGPIPQGISAVPGLDENLRIQDKIAQKIKVYRHMHGALDLVTDEVVPVFKEEQIIDFEADSSNRAKGLIEDFMITANSVTASYLETKGYPSFRRVVREPKRWNRIVELAKEKGSDLPDEPDVIALEKFLVASKTADPEHFSELSLSIIKLLGPGEYVVKFPGDNVEGHFGLAVKNYTHSTAPNRRYPDLITQRLLKVAFEGKQPEYGKDELTELARHCTLEEDAAKKVERQVIKSAAALLLEPRIGEIFDAIVTGAAGKGTWVRIKNPPVEGKLETGYKGLEVGHKIRVRLIKTDIENGFIDFERAY